VRLIFIVNRSLPIQFSYSSVLDGTSSFVTRVQIHQKVYKCLTHEIQNL